jgi:hypothetical protein
MQPRLLHDLNLLLALPPVSHHVPIRHHVRLARAFETRHLNQEVEVVRAGLVDRDDERDASLHVVVVPNRATPGLRPLDYDGMRRGTPQIDREGKFQKEGNGDFSRSIVMQ